MLGAVHGHTHAPVSMHKQDKTHRDADENLLSTGMLCRGVTISECCLFSGVSSNVANACLLSADGRTAGGNVQRCHQN